MVAPSIVGKGVGVLTVIVYAFLTIPLVPGTAVWLAILGLVAGALATWLSDVVGQGGLKALRALCKGRLPPGPQNLLRALKETRALPDRAFWTDLVCWLVASLSVAVAYRALPGVTTWEQTWRLVVMCVSVSPLGSLITYLLIVRRSRVAVARLCAAGIGTAEALAAMPPRHQLPWRMVVLILVAASAPALLIADGLTARARLRVAEVLAAAPAAQRQRALELASQGDYLMIALGFFLVAVGIGVALLAGDILVRPLRSLAGSAQKISSGDVLEPQIIVSEDEVWAAASAFAGMQMQLSDAVARLGSAGLRISTTTEQLLAATSAQHAGSAEQSVSLNETTATTEELARSARQIAGNAGSVAEIAERTLRAAQAGQSNSQSFFASMLRMKEDNQRIADSVLRLNKRVQQIGKIVEFIHEVGDKSDLLALNAELEGTKAGDVGRGFSLVAAEMRRLAESVIRSTHEIERLIEEIRDGTNSAVMATESGMKAMEAGTRLATAVLDGLNAIVEQARQTSEAVRAISLSTQQQQTGADQLAEAMAEILHIAEEGHSAGEQLARANEVLSALAGDLRGVVGQFRAGGGEAT
jgi:methyl-accepting chemotaxis protein